MLVKTFGTGGSGGDCLDYLCGKDKEKANEKEMAEEGRTVTREGASLLAGDIDMTAAYMNAAGEKFNHSYTAGVLSFEEKDITADTKAAIMQSFEQCLLPGVKPDEYNVLWVEHTDKGRLELNWVVPRINTATGQNLQPYFDAADRPRHKAWQEMTNAEYGLSSPDEPSKKQTLTQDGKVPRETNAIKTALTDYLQSAAVTNRAEVINALNALDGVSVVREVKKSISISVDGHERNIRLSGGMYEQDFRSDREAAERIREAQSGFRRKDRERYRQCKQDYERLFDRAAKRNREKIDRVARVLPTRRAGVEIQRNADAAVSVSLAGGGRTGGRLRRDDVRDVLTAAGTRQPLQSGAKQQKRRVLDVSDVQKTDRRVLRQTQRQQQIKEIFEDGRSSTKPTIERSAGFRERARRVNQASSIATERNRRIERASTIATASNRTLVAAARQRFERIRTAIKRLAVIVRDKYQRRRKERQRGRGYSR